MLCRDARSSGLTVVWVPYLPHCLLIMDQPSAFASGESGSQPVEPFMTRSVVACRRTDDLAYAVDLMSQEKVSRILCVNEEGELEGVISLSDIAQLEDGALASYTLRNVSDREVHA
jgi:CBS domain-containing protein